MSHVFTLSKEEMESQASTVWAITIDHLRRDGAITQEQADKYLDYSVIIMTKESVSERLWRFWKKAPEGRETIKFKVINLGEDH